MAAYMGVMRGRANKRYSKRRNPLNLSDTQLIAEYRMPKACIMELCTILENDLKMQRNISTTLTVEEQVLICLKLLASDSFQNVSKDYIDISQPTVSRIFKKFLQSLCSKAARFIFMPTPQEQLQEKQKFYHIAGFPLVIGAIDGTHIPIIAPNANEHLYVNRKGYHSLNVQVGIYIHLEVRSYS